jgi:hypothetical protein
MGIWFRQISLYHYETKTLEKTEGAIMNGQSRETGYTRQRRQRTQHKIPKPKKINNTDPIKNWW